MLLEELAREQVTQDLGGTVEEGYEVLWVELGRRREGRRWKRVVKSGL